MPSSVSRDSSSGPVSDLRIGNPPVQASEEHPDGSQTAHVGPPRLRGAALAIIGLLLLGIILAMTVFGRVYTVPSSSMSPTIRPGDRVLATHGIGGLYRGEVIIFHAKLTTWSVGRPKQTRTQYFIKRIIGLPGETISSKGRNVYIDGRILREPWLPKLVEPCLMPHLSIKRVTIPPSHYFVLGDCRGNSTDSRSYGAIPKSAILGHAVIVLWRSWHPWFDLL